MSQIAAAVASILEARTHIPPALKGTVTFFGHGDWWIYHAVMDDRTCQLCQDYAEGDMVNGSFVRSAFPRLEIQDENTIKVNLHPNCRCWLERA